MACPAMSISIRHLGLCGLQRSCWWAIGLFIIDILFCAVMQLQNAWPKSVPRCRNRNEAITSFGGCGSYDTQARANGRQPSSKRKISCSARHKPRSRWHFLGSLEKRPVLAAMKEHEWLWQALRLGQHDLVTALAPREFEPWPFASLGASLGPFGAIWAPWCFCVGNLCIFCSAEATAFLNSEDWKSCHPEYGTPLMATVHNAVLCPGGKQLGSPRLQGWLTSVSLRSPVLIRDYNLYAEAVVVVIQILKCEDGIWGCCPKLRQEEDRTAELIRWCMGRGADPRGVALRADATSVGLPTPPPGVGWKVAEICTVLFLF